MYIIEMLIPVEAQIWREVVHALGKMMASTCTATSGHGWKRMIVWIQAIKFIDMAHNEFNTLHTSTGFLDILPKCTCCADVLSYALVVVTYFSPASTLSALSEDLSNPA